MKFCILLLILVVNTVSFGKQSATQQTPAQAQPAVDEWGDDFDGDKLDDTKW